MSVEADEVPEAVRHEDGAEVGLEHRIDRRVVVGASGGEHARVGRMHFHRVDDDRQ